MNFSGSDVFNFGGSNAANSLANNYSQYSGLTDAFKSGGNPFVVDLANSYPEPSSGVDDDFFIYSPDKDSSIDWADIYANPDVLKGLGDSYKDPFSKGIDFLKDFSDQDKSQFFNAQKSAAGLPTDKSSMSAYNIPGTNVTLTQAGMNPYESFSAYRSPSAYGNIAAGLQGVQSFSGMPSMGVKDVVGAGIRMAGDQLANKALYAINPVLGAVNQFYPGGATEAFKDVTRFAGGIGNTISKGVGGIVKGIGNFFCDERLKVDIAPLESTEVNDELAQMAFFVKGLRECS